MAHLLDQFPICLNSDPRDVSRHVNPLVGTHYIRLMGGHQPAAQEQAVFCHKRVNELSFNYISFGQEVMITSPKPESYYHLQFVLDGCCTIRSGIDEFTADNNTAAIVNPFRPVDLHYSEQCQKIILRIEKPRLEQALEKSLGRPVRKPIEFIPSIKTDSGDGASLYNLIRHFCVEINTEACPFTDSRLISTQTEDLILQAILCIIPNNYSAHIQSAEPLTLPTHIRRIDEFLQDNLKEEISMEHLAHIGGLSVRSLYKSFEKHKQISPMAYVKRLRLERIHNELIEGTLEGKTVTNLALEYNFNHLGRFSAEYKKQFNELPSETLRNHR